MSDIQPMTPKEERDAFVRLNLTGIIQAVLVAAMLGVFGWFGDKVTDLSDNLTRTLEKQETFLYRIERMEKARDQDDARLRALELKLAAERTRNE